MLFQPPPIPPPAPSPGLTVSWAAANRDFPLYRAPWEAPRVMGLPSKLPISRPPLAAPPFRVALQRQYWFGPVSDFFLFMGMLTLGGGHHDPRGSGWVADPWSEPDRVAAPPIFSPVFPVQAPGWEPPPLRARLLGSADRDPAPQ